MAMNNKRNNNPRRAARPAAPAPAPAPAKPKRKWLLPVIPLFFLMIWGWAWLYYGDVLRIAREESFWVCDASQMKFLLDQSYGSLWYVGRMLLQLFRYPLLGGLMLAAMLSACSWLVGYWLRLSPRWRWVQYLPVLAYLGFVSYLGLDIFYETETGRLLGIPVMALAVLAVGGVLIRCFSRKPSPAFVRVPKDETPRQNRVQLAVCLAGMLAVVAFTQWQRPYLRVITKMMVAQKNQDWQTIQETARAHATQSNRPMAAYYAMALVQTDQVGERVYDIRLDYDSLFVHGWDGHHNNALNLYQPEGDYYAGLVETCYHHCYEQMMMSGPTVAKLELMTKCALLRNEWQLARKYLRILGDVPFEGAFCEKYGPMVEHNERVNADPEMALVRMLEPLHDSFENLYQQPIFMGYNLRLYEGRSMNALKNSLAVCLYTKLMPDFTARLEPLRGTMPPENFADGILLVAAKQPQLEKMFTGLDFRATRLGGFMSEVQPYMKDRPGNAKKLFEKYKGYYPYYYFFGNLKATKKKTTTSTSNSGVN